MKKLFAIVLLSFTLFLSACTKPYEGNYTYTEIDLESYDVLTGYAIAFPKGSPLTEHFNAVLNKLEADGILACLNRYYENNSDDCYESIDFVNPVYDIAHDGQGKELKVLTSSGYFPFEVLDDDGNLVGYDIDLANLIAKELNYQLKWEDGAFEQIIVNLTSNKVDLAIAAITPTPQRAENVDFSDIYFTESQTVLLYKESDAFSKLGDLKGLTIAAQSGTVQSELIDLLEDDGVIKRAYHVDYPATAIEALKKNKIDGILIEKSVAEEILKIHNK